VGGKSVEFSSTLRLSLTIVAAWRLCARLFFRLTTSRNDAKGTESQKLIMPRTNKILWGAWRVWYSTLRQDRDAVLGRGAD
jgi:hypothetical protein